MRMIRTFLVTLALSSAAFAAEPKAVISGPATIEIGQRVWLEFVGTVSDAPMVVFCEGPESLRPTLAYGAKGDKEPPLFGFANPSQTGRYRFIAVAVGIADKAIVPSVSAATWDVFVTPVAPAPRPPDPTPGPSPVPPVPPPGPTPAPILIGYDGPLWGVLVLPANPTPQQAMLQADQVLRQEFGKRSANFHSYSEQSPELQTAGWPAMMKTVGGPPVVVWIKSDGTSIWPATKTVNRDAIVTDLKTIRGK